MFNDPDTPIDPTKQAADALIKAISEPHSDHFGQLVKKAGEPSQIPPLSQELEMAFLQGMAASYGEDPTMDGIYRAVLAYYKEHLQNDGR